MTLAAVTGAVDRKDMMRTGLVVGVPGALFIFVFFYVLGRFGLI
jgi:hypothetical protein